MENKLKDFIDDWQISIKEKSATHKSGLKLKYVSQSIDGNEKIEVSDFDKMIDFCKSQGIRGSDIFALQKKIHKEFIQIYQQTMNVSNIKNFNNQEYSK